MHKLQFATSRARIFEDFINATGSIRFLTARLASIDIIVKYSRNVKAGNANAFGYTTLEPIRSKEGVAVYITKYITKTIDSPAVGLNNHLYYCSKGLKRATEELRGYLAKDFEPDYKNDYVAVKVVRSFDDASTYFVDAVSKGDAENE